MLLLQVLCKANFGLIYLFGRNSVRASEFVLDIIDNGYKIIFRETPSPYSIDNRSSALRHSSFINEAILELLDRGCIRKVQSYPQFLQSATCGNPVFRKTTTYS